MNKRFKRNRIIRLVLTVLAGLMVFYLLLFYALGGFGENRADLLSVISQDSTILFAHRGIVDGVPENSLQSVALAQKAGFRAVEIDLRKSADGDFVLFHDHNCRRMLNRDQELESVPAKDLRTYPLLENGNKTAFYVPLLTEVLDRYRDSLIWYFDLNLTGFRDAHQIAEIIQRYGIEKSSVIASADIFTVFYLEFYYPRLITALEGFDSGKEWTWKLIPHKLRPDYLSGFLNRIDKNHIDWLKKNDLLKQRIVYGVDSTNFEKAKLMGIKNIILDTDADAGFLNLSRQIARTANR